MDLSEVYSRQVKKLPVVNNSFMGFNNNAPHIEKDPTINRLEQDVFAKIAELDKIHHPEPEKPVSVQTNLKTYSVEDAIRELAFLKNQ